MAISYAVSVIPADTVIAQADDRIANCTEKLNVDRVHIGHDCGEFASVLIAGNVIIQRPWSRVNRASRAERIRLRREGGAIAPPVAAPPVAAPPASAPPAAAAPASPPSYGMDISRGNPSKLDCKDFATHAEAVAFFNSQGWTAQNDPEGLDGATIVDDGDPCESRP